MGKIAEAMINLILRVLNCVVFMANIFIWIIVKIPVSVVLGLLVRGMKYINIGVFIICLSCVLLAFTKYVFGFGVVLPENYVYYYLGIMVMNLVYFEFIHEPIKGISNKITEFVMLIGIPYFSTEKKEIQSAENIGAICPEMEGECK